MSLSNSFLFLLGLPLPSKLVGVGNAGRYFPCSPNGVIVVDVPCGEWETRDEN